MGRTLSNTEVTRCLLLIGDGHATELEDEDEREILDSVGHD